jgi:hypothetical protein
MSTAAGAARDGASNAMAKVRAAVPAVGGFISRVAYSGSYYASFGIVFPTMLVANFVPGGCVLAAGLQDGASAALAAVPCRKQKSEASAESADESCTNCAPA